MKLSLSGTGMIDIHCHILPGLDDGPDSMETSLEMIRIAARNGTTAIVATPHASPEYAFNLEFVEQKLRELRSACSGLLELYFGCDFHLQYDYLQDALANPRKYTVNHRRYLLVEFSDLVIFQSTGEIFRNLQRAGISPVITHPERNPLLRQRLEQLRNWVREGMLLQITADSLLGRWGKKAHAFAHALVAEGLAHVAASDAHGAKFRTPALKPGFDYVAERFGASVAERLFLRNPAAIVEGEDVEPGYPAPPRRKKWYKLW